VSKKNQASNTTSLALRARSGASKTSISFKPPRPKSSTPNTATESDVHCAARLLMDRFGDSALVHAATQVQRLSAEDSPERWHLWLSVVDAIQESMRYREEPDRWRPRP
jgi:hypothetical protein